MRQVRTHNFAAPAGAGVWLWPHELAALMGLPAWFLALFVALVRRSDFKTGQGRTGYGELINALTPDQPERGPRLWAPSRDDVKAALRRLESLQVLTVDKLLSEQAQTVNFSVCDRVAQRVPKQKLPPELSPGSTQEKTPKLPPGTPPGLSTGNLKHPRARSEPVDNSGPGRTKAVQVLAAMGRGGKARAPKGA